jgi:serine/threonine-protein kinase
VEAVVRRALARSPLQRFASAQDMASALRSGGVSGAPVVAPPAVATVAAPDDTVAAQPTQNRVTPMEAERAERALAVHLGPIAKVLVRRALPNATTPAAFWEKLATHIERDADRAAFLREQGPPRFSQ